MPPGIHPEVRTTERNRVPKLGFRERKPSPRVNRHQTTNPQYIADCFHVHATISMTLCSTTKLTKTRFFDPKQTQTAQHGCRDSASETVSRHSETAILNAASFYWTGILYHVGLVIWLIASNELHPYYAPIYLNLSFPVRSESGSRTT